jgi:hypothetical protein
MINRQSNVFYVANAVDMDSCGVVIRVALKNAVGWVSCEVVGDHNWSVFASLADS